MPVKYLSMADATKYCSYDQEYLSLLARKGQLKAEKVAGKWYTTKEWLNEYLMKKRPNEAIFSEADTVSEKVSVIKAKSNKKNSLISGRAGRLWLMRSTVWMMFLLIVGFLIFKVAIYQQEIEVLKASQKTSVIQEKFTELDNKNNISDEKTKNGSEQISIAK